MKCVLRAWEQLQRGVEVLSLGEICFTGMGAVAKGLEVFALGEMWFEGMGAVAKGVTRVGTG